MLRQVSIFTDGVKRIFAGVAKRNAYTADKNSLLH
jgi:hypothetical protein